METALVIAALVVLVGVVAWRPHGWGPALGAVAAVILTAVAGRVHAGDLARALASQWRAFLTLAAVMTMTTAAERLHLLDRLASWIEPRTRGPVRHAFRVTFVLAALVAAVFSNDAAVLVLTPTILALLRTVYPRRHPKFLVPFAFAIFAAAGVAPLVVSNPMNLIVAEHLGIGFNRYALVMIPVAVASWLATYAVLAWWFRAVLSDDAPALGAWPHALEPLTPESRVVLLAAGGAMLAYPVFSWLDLPLWPVAVAGGLVCALACVRAGHRPAAIARSIAWPVFPFLTGVFVVAIALQRTGVVAWLHDLYATAGYRLSTIAISSALGSAVLNNHPMSVLNVFALDGMPGGDMNAFAALVGGDLGPRLLPLGSLASLIWYDALRRHDVEVKVSTFVKLGGALTAPPLVLALAVLSALRLAGC